jgi:glycosyltransferase involved in cell wall biosynthesis
LTNPVKNRDGWFNKDMIGTITRDAMQKIAAEEISASGELVSNPMVSVVMMTRNHDKFISQAIDSVISQNCDFGIELLIGEDFSSDDTRAVCEDYQRKYPYMIRLIIAHKNVGIMPNFLRLVSRSRGKYIALLEGDDYWIDELKLQKQVDLMETHPEYSWCGAKTMNRTFWMPEKASYHLEDTLRRYFLHTSTVVFRANLLDTFPRFLSLPEIFALDSILYAYLSQHGSCGFINEFLSWYRAHPGGVWTGANLTDRMALIWTFTDIMDDYFNHKYTKILYDRELWIYKMDTAIRLDKNVWEQWVQSLLIVRMAFARMIKFYPFQYLIFALGVMIQPIKTGYYQFRRKLAMRSRFKFMNNQ